jgi:hypothetical protein
VCVCVCVCVGLMSCTAGAIKSGIFGYSGYLTGECDSALMCVFVADNSLCVCQARPLLSSRRPGTTTPGTSRWLVAVSVSRCFDVSHSLVDTSRSGPVSCSARCPWCRRPCWVTSSRTSPTGHWRRSPFPFTRWVSFVLGHRRHTLLTNTTLTVQMTWMFLVGAETYSHFPNRLSPPALVSPITTDTRQATFSSFSDNDILTAWVVGVGQIFFFSSFYSGKSSAYFLCGRTVSTDVADAAPIVPAQQV